MGSSLSRRVLVLNRNWQPVNIVGMRRAFSLLMQDHAQAIDPQGGQFAIYNGEDWLAYSAENPPAKNQPCIQTVKLRIRVPQVLLLRHYDRLPVREIKFNRQSLFERDGYRCQYCGNTFSPRDLNLDHVIPRGFGGQTSWENVVTSCIRCNTRKADRLPHQAGMQLIRKPARPKWKSFVSTALHEQSEEEKAWSYFLAPKQR